MPRGHTGSARFGQVAGHGLGQSLGQRLYWDLQERRGRVNSVGLAS